MPGFDPNARNPVHDERGGQLFRWLTAKGSEQLLAVAQRTAAQEGLQALCRRFATAENSAAKSWKRLVTHLEYRDRHKIDELAQLPARQVFNTGEAQVAYNRMMPHGLLGRDYAGRPVLYKHCGRVNFGELTRRGADLSTCLRYNEWLTERLCWTMAHQGQWTIIVDLQGTSLSQLASMKWMLYTQSLATHDALHYPDRLSQLFMINVPSFFASSWKGTHSRGCLHPSSPLSHVPPSQSDPPPSHSASLLHSVRRAPPPCRPSPPLSDALSFPAPPPPCLVCAPCQP